MKLPPAAVAPLLDARHEDILGLDIPMTDAIRMAPGHRVEQLRRPAPRVEVGRFQSIRERAPCDQFVVDVEPVRRLVVTFIPNTVVPAATSFEIATSSRNDEARRGSCMFLSSSMMTRFSSTLAATFFSSSRRDVDAPERAAAYSLAYFIRQLFGNVLVHIARRKQLVQEPQDHSSIVQPNG